MNIIPEIFYPLTIGLVFFTIAFFKWPKYALAGLIIAKPIIDLTWDYNVVLSINFLKIYAGLFVILGVIYIIVKRVPILTSRHSAKNSPFLPCSASLPILITSQHLFFLIFIASYFPNFVPFLYPVSPFPHFIF